jgi:hypothetical protein
MRRHDKKRIITEANQRLERNYLKSKGFLKENKGPKLTKKEIDVISNILEGDILDEGEEVLAEGKFSDIRQKFNSALKKGAMSFGILAAVLGSPNMTQAQKAQLKKDVTNSTWFLDKEVDFKNNPISYSSDGRSWSNDYFQQDLRDKKDAAQLKYYKDTEGKDRNTASASKKYADEVGTNVYHMEKWVNNLGQDSTVYKQYKDTKYDSEKGLFAYTDLSEPVKIVVNKDDIKAWAGDGWSEITAKGTVANWYWTKDGKTKIRPWEWQGLQKAEKLTKAGKTDKLEKQASKDKSTYYGKRLMDKGFKTSDFYRVDLEPTPSPPADTADGYPSDYPDIMKDKK